MSAGASYGGLLAALCLLVLLRPSGPLWHYSGGGARLVPYKNISSIWRCLVALAPLPDGEPDYLPGAYRRRYEAASTSGAWGEHHSPCGRLSLVRSIAGHLTVMPGLCGCWACPLCGVRRAAWLKQELTRARDRALLAWFWTLTVRTGTCTAPESFRLVKAAWNQVRTDLARSEGRFPYVWTVESTKRGYAHLHLLTGLDVEAARLSRMWLHATSGSWVVDVQQSASSRAAAYLAKYCVKEATLRAQPGWEDLRHQRFFSKSHAVQFAPFRQPGAGWAAVPIAYWPVARRLAAEAVTVRENTAGVPHLEIAADGGRSDLQRWLLSRATALQVPQLEGGSI